MLRIPFLSLFRKGKAFGHRAASSASEPRPQDDQRQGCVEIVGGNVLRTQERIVAGLEVLLTARPSGGGSGGDVYCIHSCGHGTLAKFVLLDLTGHGQERDPIARAVHALLHRYTEETQPARLLELLNQQYSHFLFPAIFASVVSAVYDPRPSAFRFANAGQPRPLHWSAARRRWTLVEQAAPSEHGLPLGIQPTASYLEEGITLAAGDILLLSSDGLPEIRNPQDEFLEPEGVLRFLDDATGEIPAGSGLAELAATFLRRVEGFRGRKEFEDDLTLLWLRRSPAMGMALAEALNP